MHIGDHILTVDVQRRIAWQPKGGVQHSTVLRSVYVLAGEHRDAAFLESGRPGQVDQQPDRLARDPVLAVVDVEVPHRERKLVAALGILFGEELAQMLLAHLLVMA